jgi:hypothetical protein
MEAKSMLFYNKILAVFALTLCVTILFTGCAVNQSQLVDSKKINFDIKQNDNFPISNIHIIREGEEMFLKGSVSRRWGKSPLISGHVDIQFLPVNGNALKKECVFFDDHFSKRSCGRQANFEIPISEDNLKNSKIKIEYVQKQ